MSADPSTTTTTNAPANNTDDLDFDMNVANTGKEPKEKDDNANKGGLDDDDGDSFILVSSDKQQFEVDRKSAKLCEFIQTILKGDVDAKIIDTPQVTGDILKAANPDTGR